MISRAYSIALALVVGYATILSMPTTASADPVGRKALEKQKVGPDEGGVLIPTGQLIRPAGKTFAYGGRPLDLVFAPSGRSVFVKNVESLMELDASTWQPIGELAFPKDEYGSMHGLAVSPDGSTVYAASSFKKLFEARRNAKGAWVWHRQIELGAKDVNPCGIALTADGRTAYVCLSIANTLAIVDLDHGKVTSRIPTGVCPYAVVLSANGRTAYVSNFGGRHATKGEHAEKSVGTPVVVDDRSIALSGTISRIDLTSATTGKQRDELAVGLHPAGMALSADGRRLFVACANSDSVSVIDTGPFVVHETISVRPDAELPSGSITNAVALSRDGHWLFAANGGNNAIAMIELSAEAKSPSILRGFIPTGWFPGALATDGANVYVANVKGEGSRQAKLGTSALNSHRLRGSVTRVGIPAANQLAAYTRQVNDDTRLPEMLRSFESAASGVAPRPVPKRPGEPSTIEHVVYVIKENRSYDQVFGDLAQANSEPRLCTFGRKITPNHHALAEEFVLLDNYYCNGVCSADGHQWATQGSVTDYQEKGFGGSPRSYDFGSDALCYAESNFLWDSVLLRGLSFRNYGEFDFPTIVPDSDWFSVYDDYRKKAGKIAFRHVIYMETLEKYTSPTYPGWNLSISDQIRLDAFEKEFKEYEKRGTWPNLVIVYLPQDHTNGTGAGTPTPSSLIADNDLALGRLIDLISHSRFWPKAAIFVNEDDPQAGWDHVDGHRSLCLVVSPYARRRAVISQFYNQLSVLHTIERILGLPSTSQLTSQAPTMEGCFVIQPDFSPYTFRKTTVAIDERNPAAATLHGRERALALACEKMDFMRPDRIDDDLLNRVLWHASRGIDAPYPAEFAGAHGKGLKSLQLKAADDDDPD